MSIVYKQLGAVHKGRPQSGRWGMSSADIFGHGWGILQIWTSTLFGAKNIGFFEIYGVSARTRGEGVEPVRTF